MSRWWNERGYDGGGPRDWVTGVMTWVWLGLMVAGWIGVWWWKRWWTG